MNAFLENPFVVAAALAIGVYSCRKMGMKWWYLIMLYSPMIALSGLFRYLHIAGCS